MAERESQEEAEEYKIPSLDGLNPSQPDYVEKLDRKAERAISVHERLCDQLKQLALGSASELALKLRGIEGVSITEEPEEVLEHRVGGEVTMMYACASIRLEYDRRDRATLRRIGDVAEAFRRDLRTREEGLEDKKKEVWRVYEDLAKKIIELTETKELLKPTFESNQLHLYIAKGDAVYEAHVDVNKPDLLYDLTRMLEGEEIDITPEKVAGLEPKEFPTQRFLTDLEKQTERTEDSYMAKNLSTIIPVSYLVTKGINDYLKLRRQVMDQATKDILGRKEKGVQ